jgi:hypothetical protein
MEQQKKKIIIAEIQKWRQSKLLPEHYCLFLLNLYGEGEFSIIEEPEPIKTIKGWKPILGIVLCLFLLGGVVYLGTLFTGFNLITQLSILGGATLVFYLLTYWLRKKQSLLHHIALGLASITFLFSCVWAAQSYSVEYMYILVALGVVLLVWLVSSIYFRAQYLTWVSILGILFSIGWVVSKSLGL